MGRLLIAGCVVLLPTLATTSAGAAFECSSGSPKHHDILTGGGIAFFFGGNSDVTDLSGTLDFGDGASAAIRLDGRVEHRFDEPGHFTVTIQAAGHVNVTYEDGTVVDEACTSGGAFSVVDVHELTAAYSTRAAGDDGRTVAFDAGASRGDAISSYEWNFGDGAGGVGVTTTHRYKGPGRFPVRLTVTSPFGSDVAGGRVAVEPPGGSSGDGSGLAWIVGGGVLAAGVAAGAWWLWGRTPAATRPPGPSISDRLVPGDAAPATIGETGIVYAQQQTVTDPVQNTVERWKENLGYDQSDEIDKALNGQLTDDDTDRMQREAGFAAGTNRATSTFVGDGVYTGKEDLAVKGMTQVLDWLRRTFSGSAPPPKP